MTTPELLTKEEERVWLATYEASLAKDAGIRRSMDVAMEAVEEWRKIVPAAKAPAHPPHQETDLLRGQRDMARLLLDDVRIALKASEMPYAALPAGVRGVVAANDLLRERLATVSKFVHGDLRDRNGAASLHQGPWSVCMTASCVADRQALGEDWLKAWLDGHA